MTGLAEEGARQAHAGKRVGIFGAGMTAATWLVHTAIGDAPIVGLFDESPWKIGRTLFDRSIHPLSDIRAHDVELVLLATMPGSQQLVQQKVSGACDKRHRDSRLWEYCVRESKLAAERRVHEAIDTLTPAYRSLLQSLVRIPSPIGEEAAAQREVDRAMRHIGLVTDVFDIDRNALAGVPGFAAPARDYANRPCVVGTLKGEGGGRSIALNAHIDTAPVDAFGRWTHQPFSGHIEGDLLYGRGAWDDKAGVVEILLIVEAFKQAGVKLGGDLVAQIVVEDEATGNGTLACLARGHHTDAAIIVDGTWPERFIVSHMGQLWFRIELEGRSAPASVASRGANPIAAIGPVMRTLQRFVDERNAAAAAWGTNPSPVFINIGRTIGGAWEGAVPSGCALDGQFGFVLPDTPETARAALTEAITSAAGRPRVACWSAASRSASTASRHQSWPAIPRIRSCGLCPTP